MRRKLFLVNLCFLLVSNALPAQIRFEKGYYINNENKRTECYIKNVDWKNNPTSFEYKIQETDSPGRENISTVKEFGIDSIATYIRAYTNIDRSLDDINELNTQKSPVWVKEYLFLKLLVKGKASLYSYQDGNLIRFFYTANDSAINQLIYKKYLLDDGKIGQNNNFRQQLLMTLRCGNTKTSILQNIRYDRNELENYFVHFNTCSGDPVRSLMVKPMREMFRLKIAPGINYASLSLLNNNMAVIDYKSNIGFRLGLELEYILPFNKNKWSLLFEPTYQYQTLNSDGVVYQNRALVNVSYTTFKYSSIEFPIGLRHYFFINKDLKIMLNAFYISSFAINLSSDFRYSLNDNTGLAIKPRQSFAIGTGIDYKRWSVEVRYYSGRELLSDYASLTSGYSRASFILGYKIVNLKSRNK